MGVTRRSPTWLLVVVGVCMNAALTHAVWGTYECDLKDEGFQKIEEICTESATKMQSPLSSLENKLERILNFVEEIKTAEDSWLHVIKKSGTVERALSLHVDEDDKNQTDSVRRERERDNNQDDEDVNDRRDREQSRQDTRDNRDYRGEEEGTRTEDDYWQVRRERTYGENRQNRRGNTNGNDWQDKRGRTNDDDRDSRRERNGDDRENRRDRHGDDGENRRERTEEDDGDNNREDTRDGRRQNRENEDESGPQKGECITQVINSHETIGMFYMMSYQHGHCANRVPIVEPIRYCLGYCTTKTFINREAGMWSQGIDCKSCQPQRYEALRIPLACDDGFSFEKKFQNVVDCSCRRCKAIEGKMNP